MIPKGSGEADCKREAPSELFRESSSAWKIRGDDDLLAFEKFRPQNHLHLAKATARKWIR